MKELEELVQLLKNPTSQVRQGNFKQGTRAVFRFLMLNLMVTFFFAVLLGLWFPLDSGVQVLSDHLLIWQRLLLFVIIMPFIEEVVFRLPLKWNLSALIYSSVVLQILIFNKLISSLSLSLLLLLSGCLISCTSLLVIYKKVFKKLWMRNYKVVFYFYVFLFALLHLFNFDELSVISAIVISIPFVISASSLSYIRLKYGFGFAFLLHALLNLVIFP